MSLLLLGAASSLRYNVATGGTITEYTVGGITYRLHTFYNSSTGGTFTFTLLNSVHPIDLAYVGGGGAGSGTDNTYCGGGGGGGFGGYVTGLVKPAGSYTIVLAAGSTGAGNSTTVMGYTGAGGALGTGGSGVNGVGGANNGPTHPLVDGVTSVQYGIGGDSAIDHRPATPEQGHGGNGRYPGGGADPSTSGSAGGAVWIRYKVSG